MITDKTREQISEALAVAYGVSVMSYGKDDLTFERALTILYKIVLVYGKDVGPMKEGRDFLNKLGIDV